MVRWFQRSRQRSLRQAVIYAAGCALVLLLVIFFYAEGVDLARLRLPRLTVPVDLAALPAAALSSFTRMAIAYLAALLFSLSVAYLAISKRWAERLLLPILDVLQSVPVLGFFPAAVFIFINMAQGERIGVELASIFLIFTVQVWNIVFGVYETWSTLPQEAAEAAHAYGVRGWLRFRRVYWPACLPRLIYNSIASWSNGWYFLIACEIIAMGPLQYELPGLGSYLVNAAEAGRTDLLMWGIAVLLCIVILMEFLLWRPLSIWATKFRYEQAATAMPRQESFMIQWWSRSPVARRTSRLLRRALRRVMKVARRMPWPGRRAATPKPPIPEAGPSWRRLALQWVFGGAVGLLLGWAVIKMGMAVITLLRQPLPAEAGEIPLAVGASMLRLLAAYLIALAWTLPVAIWASERERVARIVIPLAEIGASVPATALFPLIVVLVVRYAGDMNAASILLLVTGMQWYLLFNLVAGAKNLPGDLREAGQALGLSRSLYWRRVMIPAMLPSLVTGSITAWGGGWNALVVSEYFIYQGQTYSVHGIGSLLNVATFETGNGPMIVYTLSAMILAVFLLTQLVWSRAYRLASTKYRMDY